MVVRITRPLILLPLFFLLSACVGGTLYRSSQPENLAINTRLESVNAQLELFTINKQCQPVSLGVLRLNEGKARLGIAPSGTTYYEVTFKGFSLLRGSSTVSTNGFIHTRKGYDYELEVSYVDNVYNVVAYEINSKGHKRELEGVAPRQCR